MLLAIDEGTTGVTCLVIDSDGSVRGRGYREITQHFPRPGWVEHDPIEIWETVLHSARVAADQAHIRLDDLEGIGITNQRETVVVWDRRTGDPVYRALVWQDRRTEPECRRLRASGVEDDVRGRTGLLLDPYFSATKIAWILDSDPSLRRRAETGGLAAGTIDSWLVWKLTNGDLHLTEPTNASRTQLYNIEKRTWDPDLLSIFRVPEALLPELRASSELYGETDRATFGAAVPIAGIAGDQQAALFGQGCWTAGLGKNTYGTGAFLLLHTGDTRVVSESGLLTTVACGPRGEHAYALEGAIFIAGAAVQWLRDGLGLIEAAAETEALARSLDSNEGVYFVPAFTGLGAPHWDAAARGALFGLTRGTGIAHMARASLEAMAYSTCDVVRSMEHDSGVKVRELRVDGGAAANDWMMQFQADLLGVPVRRPAMIETTAYGAAGLAGLALGVWTSADDFLAARKDDSLFHPRDMGGSVGDLLDGWHRAVHATRTHARESP